MSRQRGPMHRPRTQSSRRPTTVASLDLNFDRLNIVWSILSFYSKNYSGYTRNHDISQRPRLAVESRRERRADSAGPSGRTAGIHRMKNLEKALKKCIASERRKRIENPRSEMKIPRLLGIFLIAICIASGFSSCCCINSSLAAHNIGPDAPLDTDPPLD
jgi:hypothetical protein